MYVWLEGLPLIYSTPRPSGYGFNLGELGIVFSCLSLTAGLAFLCQIVWMRKRFNPIFLRHAEQGKLPAPEYWLELSMAGAVLLPISVLGFGWLATPSIHWMAPTIFFLLFTSSTFFLFQGDFAYFTLAYNPKYLAAIFAGNGLCRSGIGAALPLVGKPLFRNMHRKYGPHDHDVHAVFPVAMGCTFLGIIALAMLPIPFVLYYKCGRILRHASNYANNADRSASFDKAENIDETIAKA